LAFGCVDLAAPRCPAVELKGVAMLWKKATMVPCWVAVELNCDVALCYFVVDLSKQVVNRVAVELSWAAVALSCSSVALKWAAVELSWSSCALSCAANGLGNVLVLGWVDSCEAGCRAVEVTGMLLSWKKLPWFRVGCC